jgi:hypothetical protein
MFRFLNIVLIFHGLVDFDDSKNLTTKIILRTIRFIIICLQIHSCIRVLSVVKQDKVKYLTLSWLIKCVLILISYLVTILKWNQFIAFNSKLKSKSEKTNFKLHLLIVLIWAFILLTNVTTFIIIDIHLISSLKDGFWRIYNKLNYNLVSFGWLVSSLLIYTLSYHKIYKIEIQLNRKIKSYANLNMRQIRYYCELLL